MNINAYMSIDATKPVFGVSENQPSQPQRLDRNSEISLGASLNTILFNVLIAKALIRLCGCASWSVALLFADPDGRIPRVPFVNLEWAYYNLDSRLYLGQPK